MESNAISVDRETWWLDTGASTHIANTMQGFITQSVPSKDEVSVFVGNGIKVAVELIGVVRLQLESGFYLDLEDVVYVPSMRRNLVSASKLVKSKFQFQVDDVGFSVFRNKELYGTGLLVDDLFRFNLKHNSKFAMNTECIKRSKIRETSSKLWHRRLGHISKERIKSLTKDDILPTRS